MDIRPYVTLALVGLGSLLSVLPHARAVTASHTMLLSPAVSSTPCASRVSVQAQTASADLETFTINSYPYRLETGQLAGSCWMSSDAMVAWNNDKLAIFNRASQQVTPIPGTETAVSGKHWVITTSLSPDGHWLVWAGGTYGHSTWEAITTDGVEHRQWPRDEGIVTPAIAWMQDNTHWVELCDPETEISPGAWQGKPNNMRARVYSLNSSDVQEFTLRLETPDPTFLSPSNCNKYCEFLFTTDGRAWLSQGCQTYSPKDSEKPYYCTDFYEILPGPSTWILHKSSLYPVADEEHCMFETPTRSPDDQWIVWRNRISNSNDEGRLMLSRTDGTDMQVIHSGGGEAEWSPDSRQIAFNDHSRCGVITLNLSEYLAKAKPCSQDRVADRAQVIGKFPVFHPRMLLARKH